ncbi:hypothetical protein E4U16_000632 [Claviceps sp. LM84 group G4]|nr:hypothetical protein E4U33_001299 [Claviceps sp. LM78 group G4]KAG6064595.1 hypothetical protein E4U16_000632 [Claviceps sp. LM84 group G4]
MIPRKFDLSIQEMASFFICAIRKIHDMGHFVKRLGMLEGINWARNLPHLSTFKEQAHLLSTCRALTQYDAPTFPVDRRPCHVAVVWARHGHDDRQDAPPAAMGRPGLGIGKTLADMTL